MPRTPSPASALSLACLLAASACAPGARRAPAAPEPAPVQAQPVQAPEPIGETFEIAAEAPAAPAPPPDLLGSVRYDLPVEANRWVAMELDFLVNQRRAVIGRWLERAERYEAWVQDVFARYGLPRDLHHLAMVESGYQPTVRSHAGAVGMWQFMPGTGRGMGLRIDDLVDERMDPVRATHAAARHLRQLHGQFRGDWPLAVAAYNAGSGRINRGLGRFGVDNFWDLAERGDLAQETRHYVPRLYAVTIIGRDRARFGYPAPREGVKRLAYDSVRVDLETPLSELSRIGNFPLSEIVELNPHLRQGIAPARYWVWVPAGSGAAFQQAYDGSDFRRSGGYATYTLRRGEDVAAVAEAAGVPMERIRELNLSRSLERLGRGDRIRLPAAAARALAARPAARVASRSEARGEREGEGREAGREERRSALASAARRTDSSSRRESPSSRRDPEGEDDESPSARSSASSRRESAASEARTAGRSSERSSRAPSSASSRSESSSRSSSSSSSSSRPESTSRAAGRSGRTHTVEAGETLWGIARKYDLHVAQIREANDLREDAAIQPGQTLRIPRASSDGSPARTERAASREPGRAGSPSPSRASGRVALATAARGGGRSSARTDHTVRSGETLWSIARRYETTVEAIREANDLGADRPIQPGQKLVVPRRGAGR